jgi:hypothetical protein
MSKQIIYLDELRKFINEHKIRQNKVAEICELNKGNFNLMLSGRLAYGKNLSKQGRAFNGTTEDRCKSILGKLVDYQINELELQNQYCELKISIISDSRKELIDYKKTLEI